MGNWMIVKKSDDLVHFGVKRRSGRYPYGSGDRPYQSTNGKKPGFFSKKKSKQAPEQSFEEKKNTAIESGDVKFIYENRAKLTDAEISRALSRIDMNKKLLSSLTDNKYPASGNVKINIKNKYPGFDAFTNNVGTVNNWMKTYLGAMETTKKIVDLLNGINTAVNKDAGDKKNK